MYMFRQQINESSNIARYETKEILPLMIFYMWIYFIPFVIVREVGKEGGRVKGTWETLEVYHLYLFTFRLFHFV